MKEIYRYVRVYIYINASIGVKFDRNGRRNFSTRAGCSIERSLTFDGNDRKVVIVAELIIISVFRIDTDYDSAMKL